MKQKTKFNPILIYSVFVISITLIVMWVLSALARSFLETQIVFFGEQPNIREFIPNLLEYLKEWYTLCPLLCLCVGTFASAKNNKIKTKEMLKAPLFYGALVCIVIVQFLWLNLIHR